MDSLRERGRESNTTIVANSFKRQEVVKSRDRSLSGKTRHKEDHETIPVLIRIILREII